MTVVAAIECENGVLVGCDSGVIAGTSAETITVPKWFLRLNGTLLIGWAGDVRGGQSAQLARRFRPRGSDESEEMYLGNVIAAGIRRAMHNAPGSRNADVEFLFAYRGKIWNMDSNCAVTRPACGYAAIGSGSDVATGAIGALLDEGRDAKYTIDKALRLCGKHINGIRPQYRVTMVKCQ